MLIIDLYSLLPAFTFACFLGILLWPENITYKKRLRLFLFVVLIWVAASLVAMTGYGTTEKPMACLVNVIVGLIGLGALVFSHQTKPSR